MFFGLPDKFWKYHYYSSLEVKDLLNILQCCKYFNKQKKYIYRLIYTKILDFVYLDIPGKIQSLGPCVVSAYSLPLKRKNLFYEPQLYNNDLTIYTNNDLTIYTNNVIIINEILTLLMNNEYMRNLFIKTSTNRKMLKLFINIFELVYNKELTIYSGSNLYIKNRSEILSN